MEFYKETGVAQKNRNMLDETFQLSNFIRVFGIINFLLHYFY
jgi:hypothetical protein